MLSRRGFLAGTTGVASAMGLAGLAGCSAATSTQSSDGALTGVSPKRLDYGSAPDQHGDLYLPDPTKRRPGVIVVVHGGFWLAEYTSDLGRPLAVDLVGRGYAVWNLEYRRVGAGGGWPNTLSDMATGVDHLAVIRAGGVDLDLSRVLLLGHSAGGQLAAWAAGRHTLGVGTVGAHPVVRPSFVVTQAGVLDLVGADESHLGGDATSEFLGGSATQVPERYDVASPLARLPIGVPVRCVHGRADQAVPYSQSETYAAAAKARGDDAAVVPVDGDHFALIDPTSSAWARTVSVIEQAL